EDHLDCYQDLGDIYRAFRRFCGNISQNGFVVVNNDPRNCGCYVPETVKKITFGFKPHNDFQITEARFQHPDNRFTLTGKSIRENFTVPFPGNHNILNAAAGAVLALELGLSVEHIQKELANFSGVQRRFDILYSAPDLIVLDDYAHHPTEVRATLAAARSHYGQRRIVAYVQPHTYSRTVALLEQWPEAFAAADVVLIGAIYASREKDTQGLYTHLATDLVERIAVRHPSVTYVGNIAAATAAALQCLRPGDVLLTMGAGDGNLIGEAVLKKLQMER
ncbi:MAG: hypothetical protein HC888_15385, partial [Candidatus Competibacteraceae bacterium]|nr:hypothetical protein [Candidatus Competibacteraceae bacterium]